MTPKMGINIKNVKKYFNYLKVLILVYHSWKNHVQIENSSRDMIDNEFHDFQKIDQVLVPASNKTMNRIKKTCYITLRIFEISSIMYKFVIK